MAECLHKIKYVRKLEWVLISSLFEWNGSQQFVDLSTYNMIYYIVIKLYLDAW